MSFDDRSFRDQGKDLLWAIGLLSGVVLLWLAASFLLSACGRGNPVGPQPSPTPTPVVTPPPPSKPFPVPLSEIKVSYAVCCAPPTGDDLGIVYGWPLITEQAADTAAAAGVQLVHIRSEPGNVAVMAQIRPTIDMLARKRLQVELTLLDGWLLRHSLWPWEGETCATTRQAPKAHHLEYVRNLVRVANAPHVVFDIGNEIGLCRPSDEWYLGVARAAREAGATVVGGDRDIDGLDYFNYHGFHVQHSTRGVPSIMNESDNGQQTPAQWEALIRAGIAQGVTIGYWPGPHDQAQRTDTLGRIKAVLNGEPGATCQPPPVCPGMTRIKLKLHNRLGDTCVYDATPFFGFSPCNQEHRESCTSDCGEWRPCEDVNGILWEGARALGNGYLAKAPCGTPVRACARIPWFDGFGKEVSVPEEMCSPWKTGNEVAQ